MLPLATIKAIALMMILECQASFEALALYILSPSHEIYKEVDSMVMNKSSLRSRWSDDDITEFSRSLIWWIYFWKFEWC